MKEAGHHKYIMSLGTICNCKHWSVIDLSWIIYSITVYLGTWRWWQQIHVYTDLPVISLRHSEIHLAYFNPSHELSQFNFYLGKQKRPKVCESIAQVNWVTICFKPTHAWVLTWKQCSKYNVLCRNQTQNDTDKRNVKTTP